MRGSVSPEEEPTMNSHDEPYQFGHPGILLSLHERARALIVRGRVQDHIVEQCTCQKGHACDRWRGLPVTEREP